MILGQTCKPVTLSLILSGARITWLEAGISFLFFFQGNFWVDVGKSLLLFEFYLYLDKRHSVSHTRTADKLT